MLEVSDSWKELHKEPLLPETFVKITMDLTDSDVGDVTVSSENTASFSNPELGVARTTRNAFLEHNSWVLDKSRKVASSLSNLATPGFVSNDDSECVITLSLGLSLLRNEIPGFTITWSNQYDEYATRFTIDVTQAGGEVASTTVVNNSSPRTQVELDCSRYRSVTITVHEWSVPEHRVRLDNFKFGIEYVFEKDQILSYSHEQTGDPFSSELPKNSITFSLDNSDGRWDLLNTDGLERYLRERLPLLVEYGIRTSSYDVEWSPVGYFYLTEWRTPGNSLEASFVASDWTEFALNASYSRPYREGVISAANPPYATEEGVLVFSDAEEVGYEEGTVVATLPVGTKVNVYEMLGDYRNRNEEENPGDPAYIAYRIDEGWVEAGCVDLSYQDKTYQVMMGDDLVSALNNSGIPDIIKNQGFVLDPILYQDYGPMSIVDMSVAELMQLYANKSGCAITQTDGKLPTIKQLTNTLSDYVISRDLSYSEPEVELSKPLNSIGVVMHYQWSTVTTMTGFSGLGGGGSILIDNPYMWDSTPAYNLVSSYRKWWSERGWVSGEFRADPRLELFDIVTVENKYGIVSPVMITQIKYVYSGSFHGTYKGKVLPEGYPN